jgi:hypothetical protein
MRYYFAVVVALGLLFPARLAGADPSALVGTIVISQIYGGGGNVGAVYNHDFVELLNRGTVTVDLTGWTIQHASATGADWSSTPLSGTVAPGQYYLVQEGAGQTGAGAALPAPDATGDIGLSAQTAKIALVTNSMLLTCSANCLPNPNISDFVGYGAAANSFEGSGPTGDLSNTTAALRRTGGCQDTDNNAVDFLVGPPTPRNRASAPAPCGGGPVGIPGDINSDGIVDIRDYGLWRQNFGQTNCGNPADLDGNCIVDIRDYGIWRQNFGHTAGAALRGEPAPAPRGTAGPILLGSDPAAAGSGLAVPIVPLVGGLLGLGGLAGWRRRRRPGSE